MKSMIGILLLAGWVGAAAAMAQDGPRPGAREPGELREQMQHMELQGRQMELQARANKLKFEQEMNELQLAQRRMELERQHQAVQGKPEAVPQGHARRHGCRAMAPFLLVCAILHILLTIWVYQDLRRRNTGSGIWIAVVLLSGLCGTAVYALVRLGDKPQP